jgi:tetratricopeptide (TPR) repeat protein
MPQSGTLSLSFVWCVACCILSNEGDTHLPEVTRYRAFISYSHVDKTAAAKLHRQLEGYRVPARLVGTIGARGETVAARLTPIFRDIDELPASGDLSAEIKAALAASDALIVLCSPSAKASDWVTREITLFRDMHGDSRPVLTAILSGEPVDVLPEILQSRAGRPGERVDPIAADFRAGQDGQKLALMKLVSGMTGASLATLVQRDAQRRLRRVMAVTTIAAVIMLALASSLILALRARAEAERNRNEAEGLVEYMLTDLRERLKGVGRLDVMTAVNARAMDYYTNQGALDSLSSESLEKRARILHAMGEDDGNGGNYGPALDKFMAAHRTTATILAQRPNDPDAIFAHAQSEYWVGFARLQRNEFDKAMLYWQGYLAQATRLLTIEPLTKRALMEMGYAHGNLCDVHSKLKGRASRQSARVHCQRAIDFERIALRNDPNDRDVSAALANRYGWLARILVEDTALNAAQNARANERAILSPLLKEDPKNVDLQLRMLWVDAGDAQILAAKGENEAAARVLERAIVQCKLLSASTGKRDDIDEFKMAQMLSLARAYRKTSNPKWIVTASETAAELPLFRHRPDGESKVKAYQKEIESIRKGYRQ